MFGQAKASLVVLNPFRQRFSTTKRLFASSNTCIIRASSLLKNSFYSPFRSKRKISFRRKPNKKRDSSDNVGPRNGRLGLFQQAVRGQICEKCELCEGSRMLSQLQASRRSVCTLLKKSII